MKIYVDNCILSRIVGCGFSEEYGEVLGKLALYNCEFVTSKITKKEMEKCSDQEIRGALLFLYKVFGGNKSLNMETYLATGLGDAPWGTVPFGGGEVENASLSILKQVFETEDARHLFQALSRHCNYFLTIDESTILKRYRENHKNIKAFCANGKLKIVNPKELEEELKL